MTRRIDIYVEEVRGYCALGYRPGDHVATINKYYIEPGCAKPICIHALAAMMTLLSPLLKGVAPETLGIGRGNTAYIQCPDPGKPYTDGGTVVFRLVIREER